MTALAPAPEIEPVNAKRNSRSIGVDRSFQVLTLGAGLLVLAVLALIAYSTVEHAWPAFRHSGLGFLTGHTWDPNVNQFGAFDFIYGTLFSAFLAIVISVPLSMGIALFITELAPKRVRAVVTYLIDLLAAIPSVVYGIWAFIVLTTPAHNVYQRIADTLGTLPGLSWFLGGPVTGSSFMTAGIILAVMITPIITVLAREALLTVSQEDKNAALAMGATRWEMLRVAVFPRVRSGLVGAVMLGLGRAMGETIAVAFVIGSSHQTTTHVFQPGDTMASVIVHEFPEAIDLHRAALIGLGVVLFAITIVVNMAARYIVARTERYRTG
jgi:phosphate transport system permease protein